MSFRKKKIEKVEADNHEDEGGNSIHNIETPDEGTGGDGAQDSDPNLAFVPGNQYTKGKPPPSEGGHDLNDSGLSGDAKAGEATKGRGRGRGRGRARDDGEVERRVTRSVSISRAFKGMVGRIRKQRRRKGDDHDDHHEEGEASHSNVEHEEPKKSDDDRPPMVKKRSSKVVRKKKVVKDDEGDHGDVDATADPTTSTTPIKKKKKKKKIPKGDGTGEGEGETSKTRDISPKPKKKKKKKPAESDKPHDTGSLEVVDPLDKPPSQNSDSKIETLKLEERAMFTAEKRRSSLRQDVDVTFDKNRPGGDSDQRDDDVSEKPVSLSQLVPPSLGEFWKQVGDEQVTSWTERLTIFKEEFIKLQKQLEEATEENTRLKEEQRQDREQLSKAQEELRQLNEEHESQEKALLSRISKLEENLEESARQFYESSDNDDNEEHPVKPAEKRGEIVEEVKGETSDDINVEGANREAETDQKEVSTTDSVEDDNNEGEESNGSPAEEVENERDGQLDETEQNNDKVDDANLDTARVVDNNAESEQEEDVTKLVEQLKEEKKEDLKKIAAAEEEVRDMEKEYFAAIDEGKALRDRISILEEDIKHKDEQIASLLATGDKPVTTEAEQLAISEATGSTGEKPSDLVDDVGETADEAAEISGTDEAEENAEGAAEDAHESNLNEKVKTLESQVEEKNQLIETLTAELEGSKKQQSLSTSGDAEIGQGEIDELRKKVSDYEKEVERLNEQQNELRAADEARELRMQLESQITEIRQQGQSMTPGEQEFLKNQLVAANEIFAKLRRQREEDERIVDELEQEALEMMTALDEGKEFPNRVPMVVGNLEKRNQYVRERSRSGSEREERVVKADTDQEEEDDELGEMRARVELLEQTVSEKNAMIDDLESKLKSNALAGTDTTAESEELAKLRQKVLEYEGEIAKLGDQQKHENDDALDIDLQQMEEELTAAVKERNELRKKLAKMQAQPDESDVNVGESGGSDGDKKLEENANRIASLEEIVREKDNVINDLKAEVATQLKNVESLKSQSEKAEKPGSEGDATETPTDALDAATEAATALAEQQKLDDKQIAEAEEKLRKLEEEYNVAETKEGELEAEVAKLQEQLKGSEEEVQRLKSELEGKVGVGGEGENAEIKLKQELADAKATVSKLEQEQQKEVAQAHEEVRRLEEDYYKALDKEEALRKEVQELQTQLETSTKKIQSLEETKTDVAPSTQVPKLEEEVSNLKEELEKLEKALAEASKAGPPGGSESDDVEELKAMLDEYKEEVSKLSEQQKIDRENLFEREREMSELQGQLAQGANEAGSANQDTDSKLKDELAVAVKEKKKTEDELKLVEESYTNVSNEAKELRVRVRQLEDTLEEKDKVITSFTPVASQDEADSKSLKAEPVSVEGETNSKELQARVQDLEEALEQKKKDVEIADKKVEELQARVQELEELLEKAKEFESQAQAASQGDNAGQSDTNVAGDTEREKELIEREKKLEEKEKQLEAEMKVMEELGSSSKPSPDQESLLEQETLLTEWEKNLGEKEKQIEADKELQAELLLELDEKRSELDEREARIAEREKSAGKPTDSDAPEGTSGGEGESVENNEELKKEIEEQTEVLQQLLQELEEKQVSIDAKTSELEERESLISEREKDLEKREEALAAGGSGDASPSSSSEGDSKDALVAELQKKIEDQAKVLKNIQEELISQQQAAQEKLKQRDESITFLQNELVQIKAGKSTSSILSLESAGGKKEGDSDDDGSGSKKGIFNMFGKS